MCLQFPILFENMRKSFQPLKYGSERIIELYVILHDIKPFSEKIKHFVIGVNRFFK